MPSTTATHGTAAPPPLKGERRLRCRKCGRLRRASAFTPSHPRTNCSHCRRTYSARKRWLLDEAELLERYDVLDDHLSQALGVTWPRKLLLAERGFFT